ncbi:hypothetical protein CISIN_1g042336mg [Citrus sinensis]|uniref:Uncharacterized protein n=1 Tax=Citrus sinensis TaxID=2711 RepID=A0A067DKQ9_CITSI|nr:hypothetical protein CISIN_1g042336mg [Citrus sinensis]
MVDAFVSVVLEQLISVAVEEAKKEVRLVDGVDQEVEKLTSNFRAIQAVIVDAEQRQIKEESVRLWLDQLKHTSYDMEDVLDEWNTARLKLQIEGVDQNALVPQKKKKVCSFFPATACFGFKQVFLRRDIALKIKAINDKLNDIVKQKDIFNFHVIRGTEKPERIQSTALINVSEVRGRDEEKNTLKTKLLCENSEEQNAVQVISMVGMGGIGKTTLAQFVYNDNDVINNFEKRIWVSVSDPFDEYRVAKAIIEALEGSAPNLGELNSLLQHICLSITGKKFLLVLDDVWTEDYSKWEPFHNCLMNCLHGSKILVTTRKETVARMMESIDILIIKELSELECWSLFKRFAFFGRSPFECKQLEEIGRKIVGKCKGLPLAAKTIGSLLRFKRTTEEWQNILDSEMWQLEEFEKDLLAPLLLSYTDLPSRIKRCFLYCAVFPKNYNIKKDELIKLWAAQGCIGTKGNKEMEMIGEEYFDYLATRSFFQEFVEVDIIYKMHDIVHDFAQFLTKNECFAKEIDGVEGSLWINTSEEELRHSMLVFGNEASFPVFMFNAKKLRSLLIHNIPIEVSSSPVLQVLFNQFTCLRALKITRNSKENSIYEIPKEIQKLIHLRYFKLHWLEIKELPDTCCELFNLQTIEIEGCYNLNRLPQGVGKLVNLRHLIFDVNFVEYMPKGIERLTCLRTLSEFVVVSRSDKYGNKACNLGGLRQLNHLRGSLRIRGLRNVTDVHEAKIVELEKKKNLLHLSLSFVKRTDEEDEEEEVTEGKNEVSHEAICEALRPPPNLESLDVWKYRGETLPSWIMSLNKLKKLELSFCNKFEIMPPLGKLPSLELLEVFALQSVKRVGDEFLGIEIVAFPKLKHLIFVDLDEWEEWENEKNDITIMPQLNSLEIRDCHKLKSLPHQILGNTTLQMLKIYNCRILEERFDEETGEDWSKISHVPNFKTD